MKNNFPGGVWPVMLTPYTKENEVDYPALRKLVDWYIDNGVSGLFSVCQSSEMFFLSLEERIQVAKTVVEASHGRVPVIASGHISDSFEDQVNELNEMAKTGIDALILITNRIAREDESDEIWMKNCEKLVDQIESDIPLGFYECPYPYKRVLSIPNIKKVTKNERFYFLKDTCCDIEQIEKKLEAMKGTNLKLYNANTTTLVDSLRKGATGYCGVMANFHPKAYAWLVENYQDARADDLQCVLTIASIIERQCYPVNAKYHLNTIEHLPINMKSRTRSEEEMTPTFMTEVHAMDRLIELAHKIIEEEV